MVAAEMSARREKLARTPRTMILHRGLRRSGFRSAHDDVLPLPLCLTLPRLFSATHQHTLGAYSLIPKPSASPTILEKSDVD